MTSNPDRRDSTTFRILHSISLELAKAPTMSDLYRGLVEHGLRDLGFDRMGLLLYNAQTSMIHGTWGTDREGRVCDESDFHAPLRDNTEFILRVITEKDHVGVQENRPLKHYDKPVGVGWNAMVALWDGDVPMGWITVDNLLTGAPWTEALRDTLAYYGNTAGHLVVRKRHELELESAVALKTSELADKVVALEKTLAALVESEKVASLGRLVAGVAHEINTPLGNALLAVTHATEVVNGCVASLQLGRSSPEELLMGLGGLSEGLHLAHRSLNRASALVQSFKQLAQEQGPELQSRATALAPLIDSLSLALAQELKEHRVFMNLAFSRAMTVATFPSTLAEVLGQLFRNALQHAYPLDSGGTAGARPLIMRASSDETGAWTLEVLDRGPGVPEEQLRRLFEPFFTTRSAHSGTGLGLSIVHSLVTQKMGGTIEAFLPPTGGLGFRLNFPV